MRPSKCGYRLYTGDSQVAVIEKELLLCLTIGSSCPMVALWLVRSADKCDCLLVVSVRSSYIPPSAPCRVYLLSHSGLAARQRSLVDDTLTIIIALLPAPEISSSTTQYITTKQCTPPVAAETVVQLTYTYSEPALGASHLFFLSLPDINS